MKFPLKSLFASISLVLDAVLVALAFIFANWIRFRSGWIPVNLGVTDYPHYRTFLLTIVVVYGVIFKYMGLYRSRRGISGVDELGKILLGVGVGSLLLAAGTFLIHFFALSRSVILIMSSLIVVTVWLERAVLRRSQIFLRRRGVGVTRVLVAGTGETARVFLQRLRRNPGLGYRVVGVVAEKKKSGEVEGYRVVGTLSQFEKVMEKEKPDEVIFALPASAHEQLLPLLVTLQDTSVKYKIISDLFGLITNPMESDVLLDMPVFEMKEAPLNAWPNQVLKRVFDFTFSLAGLMVLSPVFVLLALGVKLSSPGPVFFSQKRVGRDGKVFWMLKFRTMRPGSETVAFTEKNDPRVTPLGAFLRKSSADELPQLINVLLGDMSLVGPRPEVPGLVEKFQKEIPRYFERHQVKAGLTGWAQVNGFRGNSSLTERVKCDIYYIENWSLFLDIKIILRTILDLFEHEHAY